MKHHVPATRITRRALQYESTESESGAAQRASTSAQAATSATLSDSRSRPDAGIRAARPSLPSQFADLQRPGAARSVPAAPATPRADDMWSLTLPQSPRPSETLPPHGHSTPPTSSRAAQSPQSPQTPRTPRTPPAAMSPGAERSPCQNSAFDQIWTALLQLEFPYKYLKTKHDSATASFQHGDSVDFHLESFEASTIEQFKVQLETAKDTYDAKNTKYKAKNPRPDEQSFSVKPVQLMNLHIELHFGGGRHGAGDTNRGSYVKVAGYYIDDSGVKKSLGDEIDDDGVMQSRGNRVGREGAFLSTDNYNHKLIDRAEARGPAVTRRTPALKSSPARPRDPALKLLAMVILDREIVNNNLSTDLVSRRCTKQNNDSPVQFRGLMKALGAYRPESETR